MAARGELHLGGLRQFLTRRRTGNAKHVSAIGMNDNVSAYVLQGGNRSFSPLTCRRRLGLSPWQRISSQYCAGPHLPWAPTVPSAIMLQVAKKV